MLAYVLRICGGTWWSWDSRAVTDTCDSEAIWKDVTNTGDSMVSHPLWRRSEVKGAQSCPSLWDPMDCTVHGILQA